MVSLPLDTHKMATLPAQKDTTFTKIFVGGLPYHTTDESLKTFFEQFGDIDEAVVITDRQSGKSRGYGFVSNASLITVLFYLSFHSNCTVNHVLSSNGSIKSLE